MTQVQDNKFPYITVKETTAPSSPASGDQRIYIDPTDHKLKAKDSSGNIAVFGSSKRLIQEQTPTGVGTVTFSSIPATYDELEIEILARSSQAGALTQVSCYFNNDLTDANYRYLQWEVHGTNQYSNKADGAILVSVAGNTAPANVAGYATIRIPFYAKTVFQKQAHGFNGFRYDTSSLQNLLDVSTINWENTAAISRIDLVLGGSSNFQTGSIIRLYGLVAG